MLISSSATIPTSYRPSRSTRVRRFFYSLGDFTPGFSRSSRPATTMVARLVVSGGAIRQVSFIPGDINEREQPILLAASDAAANDVRVQVQQASEPFGTRFHLDANEVVVETAQPKHALSTPS